MSDSQTSTSTAMTTIANQLTAENATPKQLIAQALQQMQAAFDEDKQHRQNSFMSALAFGHWADEAKGQMEASEFEPWFNKHFGPDSRRPLSIQQGYKCIKAARAYRALPKNKAKTNTLLERYGTIKGLASICEKLESGEFEELLALPAPVKAKRGAPTKAEREAKKQAAAKPTKAERANEPAEGKGSSAPKADDKDLVMRENELKRQSKVLEVERKRLAKLSDELDERERLVALREADCDRREALLADPKVSDAAEKPAPKAPSARASGAKGKGGTKSARKQKTPQIAPETLDVIRDAAQRAVGTAGTDGVDPIARSAVVNTGAPDIDPTQPEGAY